MAEREFKLRGLNHLALVCSDIQRTIDFYSGVLGLPLVKTLDLPDGLGQHIFFDIGNGDSLAFFWFEGAPERVPGVSSPAAMPGRGDIRSAIASMNHVAFDIEPEMVDEYARRLREKGIKITGPILHDDTPQGWSREWHPGITQRSIYFFDPDGIQLEFATWEILPAGLTPKQSTADSAAV